MKRSIVVTMIALAAACQGKDAATSDTTTAAAAPPAAAAPTAAVTIVSPAEGDSTGQDVTVVLGAQGVTIAKADAAKVEGIGHYHLFLDTIPSAEGSPIPPTSKNTIHMGTGDSTFTFKGLTPGQHQVIAVIGYGDHTPMPSKYDTVTFVVKP